MINNRMTPGDKHCGPVAIASVLGTTAAQVMAQWPTRWDDHRIDTVHGFWPIDTPWLHRKFIEGVLGRHMIPQGQDGAFPANSIVLLHLHNQNDPWYKKLWDGLWNQHWVRVLSASTDFIEVDWGTVVNPTRVFKRKTFEAMVNLMWPRCVYTIK
jgi:hypothetical protein